jgi:uncharacterized protein (DUF362 family)
MIYELSSAMSYALPHIEITHLPELNFVPGCVALPKDYGTPEYDARPEVKAIRQALFQNLSDLDARTGFSERLAGSKVVIKPNLVTVYTRLGLLEPEYPETTDPRLLDALVHFLKRYTANIAIVESSGRGFPTRGAFRLTGLDRLARRHAIQLLALEEQPCDRYLVPKARVQKEILLPRVFSDVVRGEAFYISVPKMKTNLYTGVTLSFKNAMGILPYNLRQRNHNYMLEQKLVDILYLVKPDLVLIDGIVGAEGNCPAPVRPVESRVLVSGNHSVETDRLAAHLMGFNPDEVPLLRIAQQMGFGSPAAEVHGELKVVPFQRADPSMLNDAFHEHFPRVRLLVGHNSRGAWLAPQTDRPEDILKMEKRCQGGCLAVTRFAFDMFGFEGQSPDFELTVIIGEGAQRGDEALYFDRDGQAYRAGDIKKLPGKKLAVGRCTLPLKRMVDRHIDGCMPLPNSVHSAVHYMTHTFCALLSFKNRHLLPLLWDTLQACEARKRLLRQGERLDVEMPEDDRLLPAPPLSDVDQAQEYIAAPFPPLTPAEIRRLVKDENRAVLAGLLG